MVNDEHTQKYVIKIFEFRGIPTGTITNKTIHIQNKTLAKQHYEITTDPATNPLDYVFQVDPWKLCVESGGSFNFKLQYTPKVPFARNVDYFNVFDSEGICLKFGVKGNSIGPAVTTSVNKLLFITTHKKEVRKMIELKNESTVDANYQFDVDSSQCIFKPENIYGSIGPQKHIFIGITFSPPKPGIYTKDLFCLIHYQQPVVIKLEGLCTTNECKLNVRDLNIVRFSQSIPLTNPYRCYIADCIQEPENQPALTLSVHNVDFGQTNTEENHFPSTFTVTNNTKKDILLNWDEDLKKVFSIVPQSSVISSGQFTVFQAFFKPTKGDNFYSIELEGQGYWNDYMTTERNENIFKENEVHMSTCISIRMMGHTFPAGGYGWMPQFKVVPQCVILPACIPPIPVHTTIMIKRFGHLPIMFKFIPPQATHYLIKPMQGVIVGDYQVVTVQMQPEGKEERAYSEQWTIQFNGTTQHPTTVQLQAYAEYPTLKTLSEPVNQVDLPSTFLGCEGLLKVPLRNVSRHCIRYKFLCSDSTIEIHNKNDGDNMISANEVIYQTWCFTPDTIGLQEVEVKLESLVLREGLYPIGSPVDSVIRAYGLCEHVDIVGFPRILDYGPSALGVNKIANIHLFNFSSCPIYFKLACVHRNIIMERCESDIAIMKECDTLNPNSRKEVAIEICPSQLGLQEFSVTYQIRINPWSNELTDDPPFAVIHLNYEGILPKMKVLELKYEGSGTLFSKVCYWKCMNINGLNELLATTRPDTEVTVVMNFPEAPVSSPPLTIYLYLKNNGDVPTTWNLRRHQNCSCKLIRRDVGMSFTQQVYECPHRAIFTISEPSSGVLKPQEIQVLKLVIRYDLLGSWDLIYSIELSNNRKIHVNAHVVAYPDNIPVISTFAPALLLRNIFIGEMNPTGQMYWLYNNSNQDAEYNVNTVPIMQLAMCQYDVNVLKCLNPVGTVKAKSVQPIIFRFNPIELCHYEVDLSMQLSGVPQVDFKVSGDGIVKFDDHVRRLHHKAPTHTCVTTREIPLVFSTDHIIIERPFPTHTKVDRVFFIENQTHQIYGYTWNEYNMDGIMRVVVSPSQGILHPFESHLCQMTVTSGNHPVLTTARIHLEALNLTERRKHEKSVIMYQETERQLEGQFTITANGYTLPTNQVEIFPMPEPRYMVMAVTCHVSNPIEMDMKFPFRDQARQMPGTELDLVATQSLPVLSDEDKTIVTSVFERIAWDIVSSLWLEKTIIKFCNEDNLTYCQHDIKNEAKRAQLTDQSYSAPSSQLVEKVINDVIYEVLHEIFELGVLHWDGETPDLRRSCSKRIHKSRDDDDMDIKWKGVHSGKKIITPSGW